MAREEGFRTVKVLCVLGTDPEAIMLDLFRAAIRF
jgi:hypothetical protein